MAGLFNKKFVVVFVLVALGYGFAHNSAANSAESTVAFAKSRHAQIEAAINY